MKDKTLLNAPSNKDTGRMFKACNDEHGMQRQSSGDALTSHPTKRNNNIP